MPPEGRESKKLPCSFRKKRREAEFLIKRESCHTQKEEHTRSGVGIKRSGESPRFLARKKGAAKISARQSQELHMEEVKPGKRQSANRSES